MAQIQPLTLSKNIWQFDPTTIGNCTLWLDAADPNGSGILPTNNTTITSWRDKSKNNKNAIFVGTNTYLNNAVVTTSGGNYFYAAVDSRKLTVNRMSMFIVYTRGSITNNAQGLWGTDLGGGWNRFQLLAYNSPTSLDYAVSRSSTTPNYYNITQLNTSSRVLYHVTYDYLTTNGSSVRVNSAVSVTFTEAAASPFTNTTNTYFGTIDTSTSGNASFNEIIMFNKVLETDERQQLEGYLAAKWSLGSSLPATHPYNTATGTIIRPFARQFYPVDIPNCVLWLDAMDGSTVTLTSNAVSTWIDKSGYGNNATQANTSNRPTYANSAITFASSSSQFLSFTIPASLPSGATPNGTYFFVTRLTTGGAVRAFCMYGPTTLATGANPQFYYNASNQLVVDTFGAGARADTTAQLNTTVIMSATIANVSTTGTVSGWDNSQTFGTPTTYTTASITSQKGFIGMTQTGVGTSGTNASFFDGRVHEVIFYNGVLTTTQRQRVESYLMWKWGVRSGFQTTFPFYVIPNNTVTPFNPRNISGLALWLDGGDIATLFQNTNGATAVTTNGQPVGLWRDKSGNGYNASGLGSFPVYAANARNGLGAVGTFTTTSYLATGTTNFDFVANDFAMFAVIQTPSATTSNYPIISKNFSVTANNTNSWGLMLTSTSLASMRYTTSGATNVTANTGTISASTWYILSGNAVRTGTATTTSLNGTAGTAVAGSTTAINPGTVAIQIGATTVATAGSFSNSGLIGEIIIYNGTISFTEQQQIEGYLAWKWDLERNIRTSHPFYKIAS
jgi:hypothetical protein